MKGKSGKLSRKKEQAIIALLNEPTIEKAAKAAQVGEATLWRWMQLDEFRNAYRQAKKQAVEQAIARLQQVTTKAVDTLEKIMDDKDAPASSKVTAARTILEMSVKAVELEELATKVEELERKINASNKGFGIK